MLSKAYEYDHNSALFDNFINSIKSEITKTYTYLLYRYINFNGNGSGIEGLIQDPKVIEGNIIRYIVWLKQDQKLSAITIDQYVYAIMHFYSMNYITLNRKKIGKYMGDYVRPNKDRAYTTEEISKVLGFCDERSKALVLLLASIGILIGAIPSLKLQDAKRITRFPS